MTDWAQIVGLPPLEEAESKKHGERVAEGHRRSKNYRQSLRLQYLKERMVAHLEGKTWYERQWPGLEGRYKHTRNEMKRRFRKRLNKMAYLAWGIVEPRQGTGHKAKSYEDWLLVMNFVAQGWDPSTGSVSGDVPPGRWDLDEKDWASLWRGWTTELASGYGAYRIDSSKHFDLENMTIAQKQSVLFTEDKNPSTKNQ